MAGFDLSGIGALLGGGSAIAGLFGGNKVRTPGFGLTNSDEIMNFMAAIGYGGGMKDQNSYWNAHGGSDLPQQSLVNLLGQQNKRDLPQLDMLTKLLGGGMNMGLSDLAKLNSSVTGNANATRGRALGAIDGASNDISTGLTRDLGRTIQGIFRTANAGAAARGVKSANTSSQAAGQARTQTESVFDMLSKIKMQASEDKANIEQSSGNNLTNALMQLGQFGTSTKQSLLSDHVNSLLSMMNTRRSMEASPQQATLGIASGFPVYNAQPTQSPNFGSQLSGALGGIGSTIMGYANYQNQQNMQNQIMPLLMQMLGGGGGNSFHSPF